VYVHPGLLDDKLLPGKKYQTFQLKVQSIHVNRIRRPLQKSRQESSKFSKTSSRLIL